MSENTYRVSDTYDPEKGAPFVYETPTRTVTVVSRAPPPLLAPDRSSSPAFEPLLEEGGAVAVARLRLFAVVPVPGSPLN